MPMTLGDTASTTNIWEAGDLKTTLAAATPSGWLECDGSAVSRTTYAALYAALGGAGSVHGQGDGSTTFNLPDLRGRVQVGKGTHADVSTLGETDAVSVASRTPVHSHSHSLTLPTHAHSHSLTLPTHSHSDTLAFTMPNHNHGASGQTAAHSHGGNTGGPNVASYGTAAGSFAATAYYNHAHSIALEAVNVSVTVDFSGAQACSKSGGVGNNSTSPSISGSVGNNSTSPSISGTVDSATVPYMSVRVLIKT